ncbi:ThuA domain-containing protein [Haladaptatus pallidirubidus]|uniref:Trehalose utilization protein ThuA n=1 Tax=Haladaptatus pallidirubidus TaxID=1008152 RepID=A0AAV3UMZ2_9EURY|nr:ThuA domain-containing protein [Haladaptatus pallidirubidus]
MNKPRVTVWNEFRHEREGGAAEECYPDGIHAILAELFESRGFDVTTATLDEPEHGLTEAVLDDTDVLTWWGHAAHEEVADEVVERVQKHVLDGMGLIVLHSGHFSKIFKRLMGTTCDLKWRNEGERERLWTVEPNHPIARGIGEQVVVPKAEMYGERFDVPAPDELIFASWFEGGEVFRSGCCYRRGSGRIFYFRPGHETYPIYRQSEIRQILGNAVEWASPKNTKTPSFGEVPVGPEGRD